IDNARHRASLLDDGQRDRPAILALYEPARTIDGIDDEDAVVIEPFGSVGRLLAQPAIARALGPERLLKESVERDIGFRNRRGDVLGPGFEIGAEKTHRDDPGMNRCRPEQVEIGENIALGWGGHGLSTPGM